MAKAEARSAGASIAQRRAPLSADDRGALLGEAQLVAAAAAASSAPASADPHAAGLNISAIAGAALMLPPDVVCLHLLLAAPSMGRQQDIGHAVHSNMHCGFTIKVGLQCPLGFAMHSAHESGICNANEDV